MIISRSCVFNIFLISLLNVVIGDIVVYEYAGEPLVYNILKDMPSTFGESIPFQGLEAMFTIANPVEGCTPIDPPPRSHPNFTAKWVVLIARHNCTYERKVRMAQDAKYQGVIVHNIDSDNLIAMTAANTTGIHIPSVFIGFTDAQYLTELNRKSQIYVVITPDAPFNINTHLLLPFAIVVGILFLVLSIIALIKCVKDRMRARRHRLPTSALNRMLLHKYVKGDPYETCAICLDDYIEGEKLRVLPCAHAYHSKCIDPWLTNNRRVCPICKRKVFARDEEPCSSDSDTDDDTTPLINNAASSRNQQTDGGTLIVSNETRREFAHLLSFMREHPILIQRNFVSINGESSSDSSDSHESYASATVGGTTNNLINIIDVLSAAAAQNREPHGHSPDTHGHSPDTHGHSPETHRHSPDRHGHSPDTHAHSPDTHGHSPDMHGHSPDMHDHYPDTHGYSPDTHVHTWPESSDDVGNYDVDI